MSTARKRPTDPEIEDRASRAVLLALLEGALGRGEEDQVQRLRNELRELGVEVRLGVVRPQGPQRKGGNQ